MKRSSLENRYLRHGLFWIAWIAGFTFIKSFGASPDVYLGWLVYYIVTLPIFVIHTYLIVYWAGRNLLSGVRIILFLLVFFALMCAFSFIELVITTKFLSVFFPSVFSAGASYLDPGNIIVSGIGNLYILLVFVAARMVRSWYINENNKRVLAERSLYIERADANASIQPGMLLFSIESIEKLAIKKSDEVPGAIALLSELMNSVMQAQKVVIQRVDEELQNVRRLTKLYSILLSVSLPRIRIEGKDLNLKMLPAFILFSPLEIVFRRYSWLPDSILISIIEAEKVQISWESSEQPFAGIDDVMIRREMDHILPGHFNILIDKTNGTESIYISKVNPDSKVKGRKEQFRISMPFADRGVLLSNS